MVQACVGGLHSLSEWSVDGLLVVQALLEGQEGPVGQKAHLCPPGVTCRAEPEATGTPSEEADWMGASTQEAGTWAASVPWVLREAAGVGAPGDILPLSLQATGLGLNYQPRVSGCLTLQLKPPALEQQGVCLFSGSSLRAYHFFPSNPDPAIPSASKSPVPGDQLDTPPALAELTM